MALLSQDASSRWTRIRTFLLGAALFGVAIALRFHQLDRGLRHEPEYDERIFVENALGMASRGDWDHKFYEYPGLLLWVLRIILSALGAFGSDAYFVSRVLSALASAAVVALVFVAGSRWVSERAGFVAALMLTVSPIDIETVHMMRPDTIIAPLLFLTLALEAPGSVNGFRRSAWAMGTIATAVKFSAALVFVPLLAGALMARVEWRRIVAMSLGALALVVLLSPYTFLGGLDSIMGMRTQLQYHYAAPSSVSFASLLWRFLADMPARALSVPGIALVLWGALVSLRTRSRWTLAWVLFPVTWILVFSSTGIRRDRFIVPVLGALCLLAAIGFEDLFRRKRIVAVAVAVSALALPSLVVKRYLSSLNIPLAMDRALDWVNRAPEGSAGTTIGELGAMDRETREIVLLRGFHGEAFVASQFDLLVLPAAASTPPGFRAAAHFTPDTGCSGPSIAVFEALRPRRFVALDLREGRVSSSSPDRNDKLVDGEVSTRWRADTSPAFIRIDWPNPVEPERVEIRFGSMPPDRDLRVIVSDDQGVVEAHSLRPSRESQRAPFSQLLAWPARPTRTLRLDLEGPVPIRIGELTVSSVLGSDGPPGPPVLQSHSPNGGHQR